MIKIGKGICYFCWKENDCESQMIEAGKKAEPMWFAIPTELTKRQSLAMRKFQNAQKQKCIIIGEIGLCYEHLQILAKRLYKNLIKET